MNFTNTELKFDMVVANGPFKHMIRTSKSSKGPVHFKMYLHMYLQTYVPTLSLVHIYFTRKIPLSSNTVKNKMYLPAGSQ